MNKFNRGSSGLAEMVIVLVLLVAIVPCIWAFSAYSCGARWEDSGLPSKWGILSKCQVSLDGGKTFIPEERYRVIEE